MHPILRGSCTKCELGFGKKIGGINLILSARVGTRVFGESKSDSQESPTSAYRFFCSVRGSWPGRRVCDRDSGSPTGAVIHLRPWWWRGSLPHSLAESRSASIAARLTLGLSVGQRIDLGLGPASESRLVPADYVADDECPRVDGPSA